MKSLTAASALLIALIAPVQAQQLDLSHGGPIDITSSDGIEWRQADQLIIARGDAKATRGTVTVTADRLMAWYRRKISGPSAVPVNTSGEPSSEGNEIYRLQAEGHVVIFTASDRAQGDKAVYDLDQAVMIMTGRNLKLTTSQNLLTARDDLEYWPNKHMAVARGASEIVTSDARRVAADTLVAYTAENPQTYSAVSTKPSEDLLTTSGKLQRVEAFGHVSIRTSTDTVTGDRGVYSPDTGMARIGGNVRITRGQNQLNGAEADVSFKTGVANLISRNTGRVHGLVVPNDQSNNAPSMNQAPVTEKQQ